MVLAILMGMGLGALAGSVLTGLYSEWPAGKTARTGTLTCRACEGTIRQAWFPPLLWLFRLRARCPGCAALVDPLFPVIELLAILIGCISAWGFAEPVIAIAAALLGWQLLLLGALDLTYRWLPDRLNLLLAITGLAYSAATGSGALVDALVGLAAGYLMLELVRRGYRFTRGREGLGGGDPKLFAAIGCWVGWQWLPWVMVLAAFGGLAAVAGLALAGRRSLATARLPLGTLLAFASWTVWLVTRAI